MRRILFVLACMCFLSSSFLIAGRNTDAIRYASEPMFDPVVKIHTPRSFATATLLKVDEQPFFLTAKHCVLPGEDAWMQCGDSTISIGSVQALNEDVAMLFPSTEIPESLFSSAVPVESISPAFSNLYYPYSCGSFIPHQVAVPAFSLVAGYGAGFGSPVVEWRNQFGILDWKSPPIKNAFSFVLDRVYFPSFKWYANCVEYDFSMPHRLYYRAYPQMSLIQRPSSPGFSGSLVFDAGHSPVGILTGLLSIVHTQNLVQPNGKLLGYLRRLFGHGYLPWDNGPAFNYPLPSRVVHSGVLSTVVPLYPYKEAIKMTAQLYYDSY